MYEIGNRLLNAASVALGSACLLFGAQLPLVAGPIKAPEIEGAAEVRMFRGESCTIEPIWENHDGSFEGAYGWNFSGVSSPDFGAFAECFEGDVELCEIRFSFAQLGNHEGQTMDVFVWEDLGTDIPGAVVAVIPGVDPGPIATWPEVSEHHVPVGLPVSGDWWVGFWGNWPGEQAGWLLAADETGAGGCPMTNIGPETGLPSGWYHPDVVTAWRQAKSLGISVAVSADVTSTEPADPGDVLGKMVVAPNPLVQETEIVLQLPQDTDVKVSIVDVAGRSVRALRGGRVESGLHRVRWDGTDDDGQRVRSGAYFVVAETSQGRQSRSLRVLPGRR